VHHPINDYVKIVYSDRLREAEQGRLARAQKPDHSRGVRLRRRGRLRALILRVLPKRAQA
jgi:hypothetical protein